MTNTEELLKLIEKRCVNVSAIARKMELSPTGLKKKIDNEIEFKASEIDKMCEILDIKSLKKRDELFFYRKG